MKSARGRTPDHRRFRKQLADGRILRTKVSHAKMQYGAELWGRIWKTQLALESADAFWDCLKTGQPAQRYTPSATEPPKAETLPIGLVISLTRVVGLAEADVLAMTRAQAEARWQEFLDELKARARDAGGA